MKIKANDVVELTIDAQETYGITFVTVERTKVKAHEIENADNVVLTNHGYILTSDLARVIPAEEIA